MHLQMTLDNMLKLRKNILAMNNALDEKLITGRMQEKKSLSKRWRLKEEG
jgi:hypothetical protein